MGQSENYIGIFITASIVVTFLNFFLYLIIKKIVQTITEQSKSYFAVKFQVYDELIAEKEKLLNDLNREMEEIKFAPIANAETSNVTPETGEVNLDLKSPTYKDEDIFTQYRKINEKFNFNPQEVIRFFIETKYEDENPEKYLLLTNLRAKFDFSMVYNLATLVKGEQTAFVLNNFFAEDLEVIKNYLSQYSEFECVEFIKYLEEQIAITDPHIYIKTNEKTTNYEQINELIVPVYDPLIIEGIQIVYKNKLYDYAL